MPARLRCPKLIVVRTLVAALFAILAPGRARAATACRAAAVAASSAAASYAVFHVADARAPARLEEVKGCADGKCPHLYYGKKTDLVGFGSLTPLDCDEPDQGLARVDTPPAELSVACAAALAAITNRQRALYAGPGRVTRLVTDTCASAQRCEASYYARDKAILAGLGGGVGLVQRPTPACGTDKLAFLTLSMTTTAAAPDAAAGAAPLSGDDACDAGTDPTAVLECYRKGKVAGKARTAAPGAADAHGLELESIAADTLQILGQIVVDRASQAAYRLLQDKLLTLLRCPSAQKPDRAPVKQSPPTWFPETCRVVGSLRMQDLATSRSAVYSALLGDMVVDLVTRVGGEKKMSLDWDDEATVPLHRIVIDVLVPEIVRLQSARGSAVPEDVVFRLLDKALGGDLELPDEKNRPLYCRDDATAALYLSGAVVAKCRISPEECAVPELAMQFGKTLQGKCGDRKVPSSEGIASARGIAANLMRALPAGKDNTADVQLRVRYAIDAAFDAGCMFIHRADIAKHRCPAKLEPNADPAAELKEPEHVASLIRVLLVAGVEGDSNTLVAGSFRAAEYVVNAHYTQRQAAEKDDAVRKTLEDSKVGEHWNQQRALRLLGGLLQVAQTYNKGEAKDDKAAQAQHDQRTRLLESLTRDLTNRQGRDGDTLVSIGGSLRAVAGARLSPSGADVAKFYGPLSLPLGFGLQAADHFHLEASIVDLGQYLAYQEGGKVRTPKPLDALAPSLTVGAYFGTEFPFTLAATAGYSPQYGFDSAGKKDKGSINVGLAVGVYVPLLDLN